MDTVWDEMLEEASYRQVKSLLKAQTNIRQSAERMAWDARKAMVGIVIAVTGCGRGDAASALDAVQIPLARQARSRALTDPGGE